MIQEQTSEATAIRDELIKQIMTNLWTLQYMADTDKIENFPVYVLTEDSFEQAVEFRVDDNGWLIFKSEFLVDGGHNGESLYPEVDS
tara:strand:- start:897 stop:1157 length:261 start_codon:yes stop_codon:yes gene_type:complete